MISEAIEFFTLHLKNKDSDLSIRHFLYLIHRSIVAESSSRMTMRPSGEKSVP